MRTHSSKRPMLSIILPTCDRQRETERAIASILAQDIEELEVIVIDDCPTHLFHLTDELRHACIRLVRHSANLGAAAARNTGIRLAKGQWLAFLDSDDWWPRGTLRSRLRYAEERQRAGDGVMTAYGCGFADFSEKKGVLRTRLPRPAKQSEEFASGCWFCPGSAVLMPREAAMIVGPQDCSLRRLEDLDWFLRFSLCGGKLVVQNVIGAMIRVSDAPPHDKAVAAAVDILRRKWIESPSQLSADALRHLHSYLLLERGASALRKGARVVGAAYILRSLMVVPRLKTHLSPAWVSVA